MPFDDQTPLRVEEVEEGLWKLTAPLVYRAKEELFEVPEGFETDFASVPGFITWLVPTSGKYTRAAVLHDYLCRSPGFPRNDADGIFRRTLRELGVATIRRYTMWAAVRLKSGFSGAKFGDVLGAMLIVLFVSTLSALGVVVVSVSLAVAYVFEVVVYLVGKVLGKDPPAPSQFWLMLGKKESKAEGPVPDPARSDRKV